MSHKLVSVYNVKEAIQNLEIIVIDDASSDKIVDERIKMSKTSRLLNL